ncbi:MAG: hypothetical protein ABL950_03015 [Nitrospira sp.]
MTMQGCPGEEWALKAYTIYKECISGDKLPLKQPAALTEICTRTVEPIIRL